MSPEIQLTIVAKQYDMAVQDINAERFERAKQRLEYILQVDPEYSGATEHLSEVEKLLATPPSP